MSSETSFELDGDLIVVDAIALEPGGQAEVRLVLDTGAVLTTLTPTIAESIGYLGTNAPGTNAPRPRSCRHHDRALTAGRNVRGGGGKQ